MLQPGDPFILHKTYSPSGQARGQSIRKEFGRPWLEAVGLAQEEDGMKMTAQISRRLSFSVMANVTVGAAGKQLFKGKTPWAHRTAGSPGEAAECGSRAIFDVPDLGTMGMCEGGAHLAQRGSCRHRGAAHIH